MLILITRIYSCLSLLPCLQLYTCAPFYGGECFDPPLDQVRRRWAAQERTKVSTLL